MKLRANVKKRVNAGIGGEGRRDLKMQGRRKKGNPAPKEKAGWVNLSSVHLNNPFTVWSGTRCATSDPSPSFFFISSAPQLPLHHLLSVWGLQCHMVSHHRCLKDGKLVAKYTEDEYFQTRWQRGSRDGNADWWACPPHWSRLIHLNNYWMKCLQILNRQSWYPRMNLGDHLTFHLLSSSSQVFDLPNALKLVLIDKC